MKIIDKEIAGPFPRQHLETNFMPDPDLLIRTGGELRISTYLLWQIAYSELYFLARILARSSMLGVTCVPFTIPSFCSIKGFNLSLAAFMASSS